MLENPAGLDKAWDLTLVSGQQVKKTSQVNTYGFQRCLSCGIDCRLDGVWGVSRSVQSVGDPELNVHQHSVRVMALIAGCTVYGGSLGPSQ